MEEVRTQCPHVETKPSGVQMTPNPRMTAMSDPNPIPAYAITAWADDNNIYVALPMTQGGTPYITRYPRSEGGLSLALGVLCRRQREVLTPTHAAPANYTLKPQPQVKLSKAQEKLRAETTPEQRENARRLLEKLGIK